MKKILLLLLVVGMAPKAFSQIHVGMTTGVNSTFVLDKGITSDPRYDAQMTYEFAPVGFSFGVDIGKTFGLQLETIMAKQGQVFDVLNVAKEIVGKRDIDLSYIQLPLLFKFMSGSNSAARTNFSLGPQISFLTEGSESLRQMSAVMNIPSEYATYNGDEAGTYTITDPSTGEVITENATMTPDGNYEVPEISQQLLSDEYNRFKNKEFQIAASFGVDIDLGKHLYLSSLIRANYSLSDMRNGDIIDHLKNDGRVNDLFNKRSNVMVGVQLGINYTFGLTRSFKE